MIDSDVPKFFSSNSWGVYNPVNINVGRGCRHKLIDELEDQVLLIVTTRRGRQQFCEDEVLGELVSRNQIIWVDTVTENPGLTYLQAEIKRLKDDESYDVAIAFGGGSSMDAAKAINTALAKELLGVSLEELLSNSSLHANAKSKPLYTIPTTSGTGSEVTPFATVWNHEVKKKLSLVGYSVWPHAAFVDSELTDTVPLAVTVSTGLDAINQAAESIWNKNANSITIGYATRALKLGFSALPKLASGQGGKFERDQMAEASLLAGLAISHTRTALCHSISYPLTAHFGIPHGLACAYTMPQVLKLNLRADDGRFSELAYNLTGKADKSILLKLFDELNLKLRVKQSVNEKIPSFEDLNALKSGMITPGRSENNLTDAYNLDEILRLSWNSE